MAAVSLNDEGKPLYAKLNLVRCLTKERIGNWAKARLSKAIVTADGLSRFAPATVAGCTQIPRVDRAARPRDLPEFKWINTMLGNLKTMLAGTFHALKYREYAQTYLVRCPVNNWH